jgi:hypothetical protein
VVNFDTITMPRKDENEAKAYHKAYVAEWYKRNKATVQARSKESNKRYKDRNRDNLRELKSKGSCFDCGNSYHFAAMDYHHLDGDKEDNVYTMANNSLAWKTILEEIEKCVLLCSNCHRIRHFEEE